MSSSFAAPSRSLVAWLAQIAHRVLDGSPAVDDDPAPCPAARIDHPTYLRRRIAIDGMASPCEADWAMPRWQVRLPH